MRDLELMRDIDKLHLKYPFYGSRKLRDELNEMGHSVGRLHVGTLMKRMGIRALCPGPQTSKPHPQSKVYPYLLRGLEVTRVNQVWAADITYIPMSKGFCYLVAVMDWHSRKVLSWRLSNTLDASFCVDALREALAKNGAPEIFNTDQGSQFTSEAFTQKLKEAGVRISMDGRGRWLDNVMIERLWRSVKYEDIYLKGYEGMAALRQGLLDYFGFYNGRRRHQSLDRRTPNEVYWTTLSPKKAAA